ncbi:MAG: large conductance mechanosensitive channel protein MscL [Phycicoccus sp.]|nr:large conductance mechanosensitive channel protein MscL [Phycicoccus sp.]NMM34541.1 large conductance mechanosensitive channel protein MscL [Phycicoccus sp.]
MLKGFKDFLMRGNVVDLAVAVVIGVAFGTMVKAFVDVLMSLIGKIGGEPNFDLWKPRGVPLGAFLTALIAFLMVAAAIYFVVVMPLNKLAERRARGIEPETQAPSEEVALLTEIRDALRARG